MSGELYETIAALSTPAGESGIAVVRVSGTEALCILDAIFSPAGERTVSNGFEHRRVYYGRVVDRSGETIDDVMCAVMRGPESYTGEDTVEISCHGNTLVVERILGEIFRHGARSAQAGEFTKRAFLNGKIDLIQAEAVADLIHARSELQRRVAQRQLAGALSEKINRLAGELLELSGNIEANIDFIEEDIDTLDVPGAVALMTRHTAELGELLRDSSFSKPFRDGYQVVIAGLVNAGKSSLFNRLIGENRAIVTEIPGTTRDVLREPIVLDGLLFVLQDTAGLRGTDDRDDRVESIGIRLAETAAGDADLVLFVVDSSEPWSDDLSVRLKKLRPEQSIVVMSKVDLPARLSEEKLQEDVPSLQRVRSTVKTDEGLGELEKTLIETVGRERLNWIARERVVLNARLISLLEQTRGHIEVLKANLERRAPLEILALDAREALQLYETATGKRYTEDLLDTIFSRFCIGK
jgi:tRNA modification GTPase